MGIFDLDFGSIITGVGDVIDDLHTSDEEKQTLLLESKKLDADIASKQLDVNLEEAKHPSKFIAGGRPFVIWVCGVGFAFQFIIHPFLVWIWAFCQSQEWIPQQFSPPPPLNLEVLSTVLFGLLGLGGLRTYEKMKGADTKAMSSGQKKGLFGMLKRG